MTDDLLRLLVCPSCRSHFDQQATDGGAALVCPACGHRVPIVNGIPRFIDTPADDTARRTQASFGYEWTHFGDWRSSGRVNFDDYFAGLDLASVRDATVLDAGCGMGRHARQIAPYVKRVVAVDFSQAIDQAARNVETEANVDCIQADLLGLPLADASFDFVYSLGVLHHLANTEGAIADLVRMLRPGGRLRVYLYWKRHGWKGFILRLVTAARSVTTRLPHGLLRAVCWLASVVLFVGLVLPYRALAALGVRWQEDLPLGVYAKYPFAVLYNDQFDRFSAPIEKRYDPDEVQRLLENAGLIDVQVRRSYGWIADGIRNS